MAAYLPQHLQIINPSYPSHGGPSFGRFSELPPELRLRIWHISLEDHRRLLKIYIGVGPSAPPVLHAAADVPEIPAYSTRNRLGNVISGRNYVASMRGRQVHSKLLRTSCEAREAALSFFRVHIPLHFGEINNMYAPVARGTLYLSPEHDVIHLSSWRGGDTDEYSFLDFIHDLKAYDPRGTGICNLALDGKGIEAFRSLTKRPPEAAPATAAVVDCLSRLQSITWMADSRCGRAILGWMRGMPDIGVRFNHSMPIRSASLRFNIVGQDPRPVGPELKYVVTATGTSSDPRRMHVWWRELLERWEIRQVRPTKERVLFACKPDVNYPKHEVWDAKTADDLLMEEEDSWIKTQLREHVAIRRFAGRVPVEGPDELAKATRPAIGFWLFPIEALRDDEERVATRGPYTVYDLTGHWPELALSHLT
ncbi:hypothetical protein MAPG_03409 [Magnaporthiopsis poae ATCC 64411]|uniref:2EXR domain-containing protein n=1 Tax=Magnaporthiopsis poae (strain ATCC 64411 / 73-15) TaxID=644358 RepID=A0A0C4DTY0_MAGP6|nr:hypothetical protein MAPG_03409 [Magnaporthiopsis poae ATCC 64411]